VIRFALKVVILAAVFFGLTKYDVLPGLDVAENPDGPLGIYGTYLWIGLIFGVVNAVVGPILRLLSLPFVLLTLGLFLLIINAALLGLTAALSDRLAIDGIGTAIIGGLILAVAGWVADQLLDR
jgi:putative membrane protein